jgi:hypothetical protein
MGHFASIEGDVCEGADAASPRGDYADSVKFED